MHVLCTTGHLHDVTQAIATPQSWAAAQGAKLGIVSVDTSGELRIFFHQ